jgi:hypothetical protein
VKLWVLNYVMGLAKECGIRQREGRIGTGVSTTRDSTLLHTENALAMGNNNSRIY